MNSLFQKQSLYEVKLPLFAVEFRYDFIDEVPVELKEYLNKAKEFKEFVKKKLQF